MPENNAAADQLSAHTHTHATKTTISTINTSTNPAPHWETIRILTADTPQGFFTSRLSDKPSTNLFVSKPPKINRPSLRDYNHHRNLHHTSADRNGKTKVKVKLSSRPCLKSAVWFAEVIHQLDRRPKQSH